MGATQGHVDAGHQVDRDRHVKLAVTPIGPPMPDMLQAYHTSVIVDKAEFSFGGRGIEQMHGTASHAPFKGKTVIIDMGFTRMSRTAMVSALRPHFMPGTYDLLRKNCNAFSDCALQFLLGMRLEERYRNVEKVGAFTDKHIGAVQLLTGGVYQPNPKVDNWASGKVVDDIKHRQSWRPLLHDCSCVSPSAAWTEVC